MHRRTNNYLTKFLSVAVFCMMTTLCRQTFALPPTPIVSRPISIATAPPALKITAKKPTKKPSIKPIRLKFPTRRPTKKPVIIVKFPTNKPVPTAPVLFVPIIFDTPTIKPAPALPSAVNPTYEPIPIPKRA